MRRTFVLTYDEAPPSVNHGARRGRHWSVERERKRRWEGVFAMLLLQAKVPRGMTFAMCSGQIDFRHAHRRDAENYRPALVKPLADSLVSGGWLPDDTAMFFEFGRLVLTTSLEHRNPAVKGRTVVTLEAQYADA